MRRYTREEMLKESGARPEELDDLEEKRLVIPNRPRWFTRSREGYYTEQQLGVLLWILKTRRIMEARRYQNPTSAAKLSRN